MDFGKMLGGVEVDDVADVVRLVVENRDVIGRLGRLPDLLESFSESLAGAGDQARAAAVALVGDDGASGARGALDTASTALVGVAGSLAKAIALVDDTAAAAHRVPLMDGAASKLEGAAAELSGSTEQLSELARSMASIADVLAAVGAALEKVGEHLGDTSAQARGFMAPAG